ncbi:spherulation-specific family 4 protein [Acidovorax sp. SUPP3334]|uniref:spherulation-specific family 4 protein n=1 Tax=Acidovorax sp. SUPP3334 TaxID=2920881 RepID=UPI0023DE6169|nr:spherulation-specific family 4 protein [Acidovorax sp. SUPP3334]GKT21469.1 spherulation-specific family 4 protein [Acidovorax sp. SUPP3334]
MQRLPAHTPSRIARISRWCGLSLAALLAACGGGGGGGASDPTAPTTPTTVAITLTAPEAEAVFTATAALSVTARVTVNGVDAADGTAVNFSASPGPFATTGTTRAGVATATLSGAATGRQEISATTSVSGQSVTATRVVYLRPAPAALEVLVPAYFHPASSQGWALLASGAAANPAVSVTAILNPDNGVFTTAETSYVSAVNAFVSAGGKVVGYVYTGYGTGSRSLASIKANIDNYIALFGRGAISGIFLDEMASETTRLDFYREIYSYIKAKDASLRVIGNPGMVPAAGYAAVADVLVTFEGRNVTYASYDPRTTPWLYTLANSRQSSLVHNTATCADMQRAVQSAASNRYNAGPIYMTNLEYDPVADVGNPWDALPSYWTGLLQTVTAVNQGRALPGC